MTEYANTATVIAMTIFEVIADPTRRRLLSLIRERERSAGELVERMAIPQPSVSKHLKVLREARLVEVRNVGARRYYRLRPEPLAAIEHWLAPYRRHWAEQQGG